MLIRVSPTHVTYPRSEVERFLAGRAANAVERRRACGAVKTDTPRRARGRRRRRTQRFGSVAASALDADLLTAESAWRRARMKSWW